MIFGVCWRGSGTATLLAAWNTGGCCLSGSATRAAIRWKPSSSGRLLCRKKKGARYESINRLR